VATDYKDAILVQKDAIMAENLEIKARGDKKISAMQSILNH
jgi:hypothetical protein